MNRPITPHIVVTSLNCSEFRKGRGYSNWRPRGSGDWLLIQTCDGAGRVTLPTGPKRLQPGDTVLFAPRAAQDYETDVTPGYWHLRWVHFHPRPHWRPWLMWPQISRGVGFVSIPSLDTPPLQTAFNRMLTTHRLGEQDTEDLAMNALEEVLIWIHRLSSSNTLTGIDTRVQRAIHYLTTRITEPFDMANLSEHCCLSSSRLSQLFQESLGISPQRFSEKIRLEIAADLLAQTNLPVSEIAQEVGFSDPLYFSRRFRLAFNKSPSSYKPPSQL